MTRLLAALLLAGLTLGAGPAGAEQWAVLAYDGLGTEAGGLVLGRVVEDKGLDAPKPDEDTGRKLQRVRRMLSADPGAHMAVSVTVSGRVKGKAWTRTTKVRTDKRGFFSWQLAGPLPVGALEVRGALAEGARHRARPGTLHVYPRKPGTVFISDIDDTVMDTGVTNKLRMIARLVSTNALELRSFPGAPALLRAARGAGHPVVFVSGSPWQLEPRLRRFMAKARIPRAPMFLKRIGFGSDADALLSQDGYKQRQLERVMRLLPGYRVVCLGDSGEHDPEVYRALAARHPKRVAAVAIHRVTKDDEDAERTKGQLLFARWPKAWAWLAKRKLLPPPR